MIALCILLFKPP